MALQGAPLVRRGFTLLELMICSLVLTLVVMILLPDLNKAREVARGMTCRARLEAISRAVRQFEVTHGALPPGGVVSPAFGCPARFPRSMDTCFDYRGRRGGATYSWLVMVLPFLDEQKLYEQFDFSQTIFTLPGDPQAVRLDKFVCPNDGAAGPNYSGAGLPNPRQKTFAKGNYVGYLSPVHPDHLLSWEASLGGFTPGARLGQPLRRVTDGAAHTLLATEVRTLDRAWDSRGVWAAPLLGGSLISLDHHPMVGTSIPTFFVADPQWSESGTPNRQLPDQIVTCSDTTFAQARKMPCETISYGLSSPRSNHAGGVHGVAIDGRSMFLADGLHPVVFAYLVSSDDGHLTSGSDAVRGEM